MEDKRITKTKKNIKNTLIEMLQEMKFEKITVSEICRRGSVSRITFYTYYEDKYSLVVEMFNDYTAEAHNNYVRLQKLSDSEDNYLAEYENLLEAIICLYYDNIEFFSKTSPQINPYLFAEFQNHVLLSVANFFVSHNTLKPKYSANQTSALICNGLFGVINVCNAEQLSSSEVKKLMNSMYKDVLLSDLFTKGKVK